MIREHRATRGLWVTRGPAGDAGQVTGEWAVVGGSGFIVRKSGGITVIRLRTGVYGVDFGHNVSQCAITGSLVDAGAGTAARGKKARLRSERARHGATCGETGRASFALCVCRCRGGVAAVSDQAPATRLGHRDCREGVSVSPSRGLHPAVFRFILWLFGSGDIHY